MYYLIWLCIACSNTSPINLGLYDNANACERAKQQVWELRGTTRDRGYMKCINKGGN